MAFIFEYIRSIVGKDYFTQKLHDNEAGIFYDLGSGTGKAIIAMSLFCPFKKLVGIELLKGLWDLSMRSRFAYYKNISDKFMKFNDLLSIEKTNEIEFYNGDFLRQKWTDAAIVFANSTCFSDDLMYKIGIKAMFECKVDCILITISKKIKNFNNDWECKEDFKRIMSWGLGSIFIYIRRKVTVNKGEYKLID